MRPFDFLYKFFSETVLIRDEMGEIWSQMYIGLHVQYSLLLSDFNET